MGTWGNGNFQDDEALDWLGSTMFDPLVDFVEANISTTDPLRSKEVVAAVEVLVVLYKKFKEPPPGLRRVTRWRATYLEAWERTRNRGVPKFITARRRVIKKTFDNLLAYSSGWEDIDDE